MKSPTKERPLVSCFVKPLISSAFRFHSVMRPAVSTPKMGALAVSMSRDRSSAMRCCSAISERSSEMSWPTPITPVTSPSAPRRVVAFSRISRRWPSLVNNGNSKLAVSWPESAMVRTLFTSCRYSRVMKDSTNGLPTVCSLSHPDVAAAFWFHSVTQPLVSIPKMGALAVSIKRVRSSATRLLSFIAWRKFVISCPTPTTPVT
mmetsp:Transcript_75067/g.207046  ORF Transcript_75067/g.207046 Transcript_75067/m.207046 type:complete len:204 (+) Transcript_75067:195-806(+)